MGDRSPKLLFEIKIYEDGTMTINDKPFSDFIKEKIREELKGAGESVLSSDSALETTLLEPDTTEDINIFWCNNCPR